MLLFLTLAASLVLLAILVVAVPLLRGPGPAPWAALGSIAVLLLGSTALYATWSNWNWPEASASEASGSVSTLARRLARQPDDLDGWLQLGGSYSAIQQYPLALRAYERADALAGGRSVEALVGMAETLAVMDDSQLVGRAGDLFERALELDPQAGKALFFGAITAMRRGELPKSRERFARLLTLDPPQAVRPLIEQQIAALDNAIGGAGPAGGTGESAPATTQASVRVTVSAPTDVANGATAGTPLFVFVRDPDTPGPPLAVKRVAAKFPLALELTAADAMMPSRAITAGKRVLVVARISRTGQPEAASGDPYGEVSYDVGKDGVREIVIDRVTP
jgi:cytochrome c-type biogenesis protein CcmH